MSNVGRPLKFNTPEEMQIIIDEYFEKCKPELQKDAEGKLLTNNKGFPVIRLNPPTLTGLALTLGFVSRQSIYDYENRSDEFSYTLKTARLRCENWVENGLLSAEIPPASGIFVLKNHGWKDTQEIEHKGKITSEYSLIGVDADTDTKKDS